MSKIKEKEHSKLLKKKKNREENATQENIFSSYLNFLRKQQSKRVGMVKQINKGENSKIRRLE